MEKRLLLACALSLAFLLLYQQFLPTRPAEPRQESESNGPLETDSGPGERNPAQDEPADPKDPNSEEDGVPANGTSRPGDDEVPKVPDVTLENQRLRVVFTQRGASVREAWLLDKFPSAEARTAQGGPLQILMPSERNLSALRWDDLERGRAAIGERRWRQVAVQPGRSVSYETSYTENSGELETTYHLRKDFRLPRGESRHLEVSFSWRYEGAEHAAASGEFGILVSGGVFQDLGSAMSNPPKSATYPIDGEVEVHTISDTKSSEIEKLEEGGDVTEVGLLASLRGEKPSRTGGFTRRLFGDLRYVADCSNYFGAFFILEEFPSLVAARIHSTGLPQTRTEEVWDQGAPGGRTATLLAIPKSAEKGETQTWKGLYYLGPIDRTRINAALEGVVSEEQIDAMGEVYRDQLGFARSIAGVILMALRGLHGLVGNWGWAIILLTLCVRLVLFPLNRKSQGAMLRMQEAHSRIKPKLDAIKEKYKDEPKVLAQKQMELFRAEKVPMVPVGGCLPIFLQMPIFFGLFSALRASVDLRQAEWWWVADLSQPDRLVALSDPLPNPLSFCCGDMIPLATQIDGLNLLPILMTVAWIVNSMSMPRPENPNPQMEQQRKMMMFMPLLFGFFMYGYAAGLSLYWLTSSLVGIVESRVIKKLVPIKTK